jgi:anti-sigma B factor antagonist
MAGIGEVGPEGLQIQSGRGPDGEPLITVTGELDLMGADALRQAIAAALQSGRDRLALDLSGLRFIDSAGLAVLIEAASRVETVELRSPSDAVRRAVELTGLTDVLRMVP